MNPTESQGVEFFLHHDRCAVLEGRFVDGEGLIRPAPRIDARAGIPPDGRGARGTGFGAWKIVP